jgi:transposase
MWMNAPPMWITRNPSSHRTSKIAPAGQQGFAVIPRRWAVERTLGWLTAHRRLARDYERHPATSEAVIRWAAINTITRRIARGGPAIRQQRRTFPS